MFKETDDISDQYVAGVADSDGTFVISRRHRDGCMPMYSARFLIQWVMQPEAYLILKSMQKRYGGNLCVVNHKHKGLDYPMYAYSLSDKRMDKFLSMVGPHVILKRKQVDILIGLRQNILSRDRSKHPRKTEEMVQFQHECMIAIQKANSEGKYRG